MTEIRGQKSEVRNQREEINRRDAECAERFLCALCASVVKTDLRSPTSDLWFMRRALGSLLPAEAQQSGKVPRIGVLISGSLANTARNVEAFQQGLREHGYVAPALREFETALKENPNRYRGLYGAARAAEAAGERQKAADYFAKLVKVAEKSDSDRPEIAQAKVFLAKK